MNQFQLLIFVFLIDQVITASDDRISPKLNRLNLEVAQSPFEFNSNFSSPFTSNRLQEPKLLLTQDLGKKRRKSSSMMTDCHFNSLQNPEIVSFIHNKLDMGMTTSTSDVVCMVTSESTLQKKTSKLPSMIQTIFCVIVFFKSTDEVGHKNRYHTRQDAFNRVANVLNLPLEDEKNTDCCC